MILVEIRCKVRGCGKLLAELDRVPRSWDGYTWVPYCPRHGGSYRRPDQMRDPSHHRVMGREHKIPNAELRPYFDAARNGETQPYVV